MCALMQLSAESTFRKIAWGPRIAVAGATLLFLLGAGRFVLAHRFSLSDALYCCLLVIPAWLLLIVSAYVVQHAILASVIPIAAAAMWVYSSPAFDVALAFALMGMLAESATNAKNAEEAWRKYNDEAAAEKEERK
jgi:hypothetical protein